MYTGRIVADTPSSYRNTDTTLIYPRSPHSDTRAAVAHTYLANCDSLAAHSNAHPADRDAGSVEHQASPADGADIPHRPRRQRSIGQENRV